MEMILNTLVYDGKIERILSGDGNNLYRVIQPLLSSLSGLMRTPCGLCPVRIICVRFTDRLNYWKGLNKSLILFIFLACFVTGENELFWGWYYHAYQVPVHAGMATIDIFKLWISRFYVDISFFTFSFPLSLWIDKTDKDDRNNWMYRDLLFTVFSLICIYL